MALVLLMAAPATLRADDNKETAEKQKFFLEKVRPLLWENCLRCHGPEKSENGLRVDSRKAILEGGETGEAVIPGDPEASLLLKAIQYGEQDLQMPPERKFSEEEISTIEKWIKDGAVWAEPEKKP